MKPNGITGAGLPACQMSGGIPNSTSAIPSGGAGLAPMGVVEAPPMVPPAIGAVPTSIAAASPDAVMERARAALGVDGKTAAGPDTTYVGMETVNGIDISVGWDKYYKDYTICFPQIEIGDAARDRGVYDQVQRITQRVDVAKQVFEEAVRLVKSGERDVYSLFKKIEKYRQDLPYEYDAAYEETPARVETGRASTLAARVESGPDKSYVGWQTVNGVVISVGWDEYYKDYTIFFPQIEIGDAARDGGVYDQVLRITQRADVAKQVFEEAVRLVTGGERDVYRLYKKIEKYSEGLPHE